MGFRLKWLTFYKLHSLPKKDKTKHNVVVMQLLRLPSVLIKFLIFKLQNIHWFKRQPTGVLKFLPTRKQSNIKADRCIGCIFSWFSIKYFCDSHVILEYLL